MSRKIFVNLPVTDLARAVAFYQAIGAHRDDRFSDDTAVAMVLSDTIHVMLLTHAKFRQFTPRPIADARAATEVLIALDVESRDAVDTVVGRAAAAGGQADPGPVQDLGFMVSRSIADPDGHIWELFWMDPVTAAQGVADTVAAGA